MLTGIIALFTALSYAVLRHSGGVMRAVFGKNPGTDWWEQEVVQMVPKAKEVTDAKVNAFATLPLQDQILLGLGDVNITQVKATHRKMWKRMDPRPFADLYRAQGLTLEQIQKAMEDEKMPGYFRKKVIACYIYNIHV